MGTLTTLRTDIATPTDVLEGGRRMAPAIAARAAEIEAARRVPGDLLDELIAVGAFRVLRPRSHGGLEADLSDAMRVYEAFAAADASVGLDGADRVGHVVRPRLAAARRVRRGVLRAGRHHGRRLQPERLDRRRRTAATA